MRRAALWIGLFALGVGVLTTAVLMPPLRRPPADGASELTNLYFQPHPGATLPLSTNLVDEDGHSVPFHTYFSKAPVIVVLEYLHCTSLCGVTLHNLVEELAALPLEPGRDYQFVAISIDPRDKPADAAAARTKYLAILHRTAAESGVHFLTGPDAAVRVIADAAGFPYRYDQLLDAYIHPAGFLIATPDGVINRYIEGAAISPGDLVNALADAEQDRSQGPLTRILLLCHVQGAPLGRFTVPVLAAFTAADLAAGFTLIAVFAAIRRRRHA